MHIDSCDYPNEPYGSEDDATGMFVAETLLPIVRAAMTRGEGPPAVLTWILRQGQSITGHDSWTLADETRARVLARCLAETLNDHRRSDAMTYQAQMTYPDHTPMPCSA